MTAEPRGASSIATRALTISSAAMSIRCCCFHPRLTLCSCRPASGFTRAWMPARLGNVGPERTSAFPIPITWRFHRTKALSSWRGGKKSRGGGAKTEPGEWRRTHVAESGVVRSRDGGHDWTLCRGLDIAPSANIEAMTVAAYPGGYTLFVGDTEGMVYASDDGGDNWV